MLGFGNFAKAAVAAGRNADYSGAQMPKPVIDWSKPVRTTPRGYKVTIAPHPSGGRVLAYWYDCDGDWCEAVLNKFTGEAIYVSWTDEDGAGEVFVENVPEETIKDHCLLVRDSTAEKWMLWGETVTKYIADSVVSMLGTERAVAVKVPA